MTDIIRRALEQQAGWERVTEDAELPSSEFSASRILVPLTRWQRIRDMPYWAQSVGAVALLLKAVGLAVGLAEVRHEFIERTSRPFSVADTTTRNSRISDVPIGGAATIWYASPDSAPKTIVLENGSKVTLTPGSSFSLAQNPRHVLKLDLARLDGEATIELPPNAPFMKVAMAAGNATLNPGRYRLRGTPNDLELDVFKGFSLTRMTGLFVSIRPLSVYAGQQARGRAGHLAVRSPLLAPSHP